MTIECYIKECPYHSIHDCKPGEDQGPFCWQTECMAKRLSDNHSKPRPRIFIEDLKTVIHYAANPYQGRYHTLCGILQKADFGMVPSTTTSLNATCQTCINIDTQLHGFPDPAVTPIDMAAAVFAHPECAEADQIERNTVKTQQYSIRYVWALKSGKNPVSSLCFFNGTSIQDVFKQFMATYNKYNPLVSITIKPAKPEMISVTEHAGEEDK
jgi:hypothetical protein